MMRIPSSLVSVALIGLSFANVVACSGGGGDGGGSSVTTAQAASDVSAALCARFEACSAFYVQISFGDVATCSSRENALFTGTLSAPGTGWTPAAVEACVKAIPGASCDDALGHNLPAACHPPAGQVANGGACGDNSQCTSGYCNLGPGGKCGTCAAALGAAGAACYRDDDCAFGTFCTGDDVTASPEVAGKCTAPGASGASCDADHPCSKTLACTQAGTCGAPSAEGDACAQGTVDPPFGNCDLLAGDICSKTNAGTCEKIGQATAGQPCGSVAGTPTICASSGKCAGAPPSTTCMAPAADFGDCNTDNGPLCAAPAQCIGSICVVPTPDSCP
jgi:hypothetical protein